MSVVREHTKRMGEKKIEPEQSRKKLAWILTSNTVTLGGCYSFCLGRYTCNEWLHKHGTT